MTKLPSLSDILARKEELDNLEKSKQNEKTQKRISLEDRCKAAIPRMLDLIQSNMDPLILGRTSIEVLYDPVNLDAKICKNLLEEELKKQGIAYLKVDVQPLDPSDFYGLFVSINGDLRYKWDLEANLKRREIEKELCRKDLPKMVALITEAFKKGNVVKLLEGPYNNRHLFKYSDAVCVEVLEKELYSKGFKNFYVKSEMRQAGRYEEVDWYTWVEVGLKK